MARMTIGDRASRRVQQGRLGRLGPLGSSVALVAAGFVAGWYSLPVAGGSTNGNLPFNQGLDTLLDNFEGPTGTALLLMAIIWGLIKWSGSERGSSGLIQAAKGAVSLAVIATLVLTLGSLGINAAAL